MIKKWVIILFILVNIGSISYAIEKAERISDREIVERLTRVEIKLDEGQKAMNQRLDEMKLEIKDVRTEIKDVRIEIRSFMVWGFGVTFAGIFSLIGFVLWDRRSALAPAIRKNKELEEREEALEKWKKKADMALKELAKGDVKVAGVLRQVGLL
ncbi:MAG: hypothetical protein ABII25_09785 [bacterium]